MDVNGLIGDLAFILLLGAASTLLFKWLKQPVVLGYLLAGFLASPKFIWIPSVSNLDNIEFWAQIGIVVLMFCLGLEFSFKKLVKSGSSAVVTALIIIVGMTFAGFGVGKLLHLDTVNCIFLGGMISMSSTTIILKALNDAGLRQHKFASLVLAVLIVEDLFAVVMLVLLSSIALGNVGGGEMLFSVAKLCFFLIIWFLVGVFVLPSFLEKSRSFLNNETLLVVSMGLCFGMAVFSVYCGFSIELGAFVMGSLLAGTVMAERIEHIMTPIKDLFGAVFFISVGMMVDPIAIGSYWGEILLLAVVVVVGMIIFGTLGMLVGGQNLRVALQSGFTLTQVGEFSFIIAALGMSLNVLQPELYPIIVAVSVITIFTTPYFIKMAEPTYKFIEPRLPKGLRFLIDRYTAPDNTADKESRQLWKRIIKRYVWRILLFSVVLAAISIVSFQFLFPWLIKLIPAYGRLIATIGTLVVMAPFLISLSFSSVPESEKQELSSRSGLYSVPLTIMRIVRYFIALLIVVYFISVAYNPTIGWIAGIIYAVIVIILASRWLTKVSHNLENRFFQNLNIRENTALGRNNNLIDDLHQAFILVGPYCSFVGDRLRDSGLRRDYGVSVSSIQRDQMLMPLPSENARIFPGDVIGVIGTDNQLKALNDDIEKERKAYMSLPVNNVHVELRPLTLTEKSPLVGIPLADTNIRKDFYSMIVKIVHEDKYISPTPQTVLQPGDIIWVVGDPAYINAMK